MAYKTYQCPDCEGTFRFFHHPADEPPPSFCPLCGADVSGKKKKRRLKRGEWGALPDKKPPGHRSVVSKSVDSVYRGMEAASEERIRQAAELLGEDPRNLSAMKMTNMKDNLREGDFSAMQSTTPSTATQITGTPMGQVNFQDKTAAVEFAKSVGQGVHPYAGNKAREMVGSAHQMRAQRLVSAGRLNKK